MNTRNVTGEQFIEEIENRGYRKLDRDAKNYVDGYVSYISKDRTKSMICYVDKMTDNLIVKYAFYLLPFSLQNRFHYGAINLICFNDFDDMFKWIDDTYDKFHLSLSKLITEPKLVKDNFQPDLASNGFIY